MANEEDNNPKNIGDRLRVLLECEGWNLPDPHLDKPIDVSDGWTLPLPQLDLKELEAQCSDAKLSEELRQYI